MPALQHAGHTLESVPFDAALDASRIDCAVIYTDHAAFDYARLARSLPLIVDTRNALREFRSKAIFAL